MPTPDTDVLTLPGTAARLPSVLVPVLCGTVVAGSWLTGVAAILATR